MNALKEYQDIYSPVLNVVYNVESTIVDTGFPIEVKEEIIKALTFRSDINLMLSTKSVDGIRKNVETVESMTSVAEILTQKLKLFPESVYYNTSVARAVIIGGDGVLVNGKYTKRVPATFDLAVKLKNYMGAANYKWDSKYRFDMAPGNIIRTIKKIEPKDIADPQKPILWSKQLIYPDRYNRMLYQFPQTQTVYPEDSSTLNSLLVMMAISTLVKIGVAAHREFTGSSRLSPEELAERVVGYVSRRVTGIFDESFLITPTVTYTAIDKDRGYSWTLDIAITGSRMMTVETLSITAKAFA